jgi:hypothetical protein
MLGTERASFVLALVRVGEWGGLVVVIPDAELHAGHQKRRYDAHMKAARAHDSAATIHDEAAEMFQRIGQIDRAKRELDLAQREREGAATARSRAVAELF